jgi:hypothetical protein
MGCPMLCGSYSSSPPKSDSLNIKGRFVAYGKCFAQALEWAVSIVFSGLSVCAYGLTLVTERIDNAHSGFVQATERPNCFAFGGALMYAFR